MPTDHPQPEFADVRLRADDLHVERSQEHPRHLDVTLYARHRAASPTQNWYVSIPEILAHDLHRQLTEALGLTHPAPTSPVTASRASASAHRGLRR